MEAQRAGPRPLVALCAPFVLLGLALRLAFLWAARDAQLVADEGFYAYAGLSWHVFGFYSDSYRYLWPPGFPWLLKGCLAAFGEDGLFAARCIGVLASVSTGLSVMLIALRLFGARAARLAGLGWALYLPLIGFSHSLWTEATFSALFAPALLLVLAALQDEQRRARRVACAAVLFAGALYLKESPLYLAPLIALLLAGVAQRREAPARLAARLEPASLWLLVLAVLILPWTLRNADVYGRFVPLGASLGENAYRGLNANYTNFDLALAAQKVRAGDPTAGRPRAFFSDPAGAAAWTRADELPNTIDRQAAGLERGLGFAAEHPGWFLRSRVKKLADLFAPVSFFLRHLGLEAYGPQSALTRPALRRPLALFSVALPLLLLPLAWLGLLSLRERPALSLCACVLSYFVLTAALVAMSRFRVPMLPLLIPLAAGALARGPRDSLRALSRPRRIAACAGWALLVFLWWVDLPETLALFSLAWKP